MGERFQRYKRHQKRRKAEVVNGLVFYNTDQDIQEAVRSALQGGRFTIELCDQCKKKKRQDCGNCRIQILDEDGNIISHDGNTPEGFEGTLHEWIVAEFAKSGVKMV
jgi:hypothetical protein